ncbi:MAG: thioesterase family protein [Hyphomicrobiales bacterium]|nr:thioesterase family protein [Hyphomicrobiales bacterium]
MSQAALPAPLFQTRVQREWIDYNGHMNDAWYAHVFSKSVDRVMSAIGLDQDGRARTSRTIYTLTMTIHYLNEVHAGEALAVRGRILAHDDKRLHLWLEMTRGDGATAALNEQMLLCVDQSGEKPRGAPFEEDQIARIRAFHAFDADKAWPKQAGRGIALARPA